MLLKELETCNNTAFISSDFKIRQWELILRQKGVKKISAGKDILIPSSFGYIIRGWIPTFIIKRIGGVINSGILDRWDNILSIHLANILTKSSQWLDSNGTYKKFYVGKPHSTNPNEQKSRSFFLYFILGWKLV